MHQTKQPDEVYIRDDCSSDDTVSIIKDFIEENYLQNWKIHINSSNMGFVKKFFDVMCETSGDIIFMCYQDDIWMLDKIEVMSNIMSADSSILCLAGQDIEIDEDGEEESYIEYREEGQQAIKKIEHNHFFYRTGFRGCTMAIIRELLQLYKELCCIGILKRGA